LQSIRFHIDVTGDMAQISSTEFGGSVAMNQNFGTLVGLKHGLLLESPHETKLLLPHAAVCRYDKGNHCTVHLDLSDLRDPACLFIHFVQTCGNYAGKGIELPACTLPCYMP